MIFLSLLLIALLCEESIGWKFIHHGRLKGGNLKSPGDTEANEHVKELRFLQQLDHFNPGDMRNWEQRYFVNDEFYKGDPKGPVFLMIGGEGEATDKWMTKGTWIDYAKRLGALCFQLEHRYYGKSHPTEDLSTKNLQYLTSQQALADIASFVVQTNQAYNMSDGVKWIAYGGSYPGSLAAWVRNKYPHLIHGSMSASGPLLALIDFKDYFRVVDEALATHSQKCVDAVKKGTMQVDILLKHMVGQRNIDKLFNLCDPIEPSMKNKRDIANFFESLAGNFAGIVQYNKDNRMSASPHNVTIDTLCDVMVNDSIQHPVTRLAMVNDIILSATKETCLDYKYDKMIAQLSNSSWNSETAEGGRQWTYQTCTEFGFFQTSAYTPQVFGDKFPADFFVKQCVDIFGPKYNDYFLERAMERTNTLYGALDLEVTNVVFVHGSIDPWHALGITETRDKRAPAIFINGTAHCANMYPERSDDLQQLKDARVTVYNYIDSWLRS